MNILMLTDRMDTGGAETHILTLAKALKENGHSVAIVSSGGRIARLAVRFGIRHYTLSACSGSVADILVCFFKIIGIAKKERVQMLHAHARSAALVGTFVSKALKIPLTVTAHAKFSPRTWRRYLSQWGCLTCAVSEDVKEHICTEFDVFSDNVSVIRNGVDTQYFSPRREKDGERKKCLRLVFMSRMDGDCSSTAYALCSIAKRLYKEFPNLKITLAGGGSEYLRVKRVAYGAALQSGMDIRVIGNVVDTARLLKSADIFVGVSRAAIEAMACGVPCVISGNEGYLGVIDENNFCIAESDNFCARCMVKLQTNELYNAVCADILKLCRMTDGERKSLGLSLSKKISESHSSEKMVSETENFYKKAIQRKQCKSGDIVISGYYGYGNTGDDALLFGAIKRAKREYPSLSVSALTAHGRADGNTFGVRCVRRKSLFALREIKNARLFVFGGGTLLQDKTSKRSLIYYLFLLRYAQRHGIRCELWGNGIGDLRVRLLRSLCSRALSGCAHIGVRDVKSAYAVMSLTTGASVLPELEDDLSSYIEPSSDERRALLLSKYLRYPNRPYAVIAVNGGMVRDVKEREELLRLIDRVRKLKERGMQFIFVAMHSAEDGKLSSVLAKRFDALSVSLSPSDAMAVIGKAKTVLASRYHALLFALRANIDYEIFGRDPKLYTVEKAESRRIDTLYIKREARLQAAFPSVR